MGKDRLVMQPNCEDDYDTGSLTCEVALSRILGAVRGVSGIENVPLREALGRVVATPVVSPINVPSHTNSAMDGYAVRSQDVPESGSIQLKVIGTAFAGTPYQGLLGKNEAIRVMTGAVIPPEANIVIMQEQVEVDDDGSIRIDNRHRAGQNVRAAGEDIGVGTQVLHRGHLITPADLGLVASIGLAKIDIFRRIRVAFFSTGDELRGVGETLEPGQIYDSNRYTLFGMLTRLGVEVIDMGVVKDSREAVRHKLIDAAKTADLVITSGGVSVGEADYIKEVLREIGEVRFWKVAMKPGRPLAFGAIDGSVFFGLPGNPVSVMVTFYQFVQPCILKIMGGQARPEILLKARTQNMLKKRPGRVEYQRGIVSRNDAGELVVHTRDDQGSGILSSMSTANCFVILPMDSDRIESGSLVDIQPFFGIV